MPTKLSYEYVFNYFKEQYCELLELEYINNKTKMKYKCSCGNISQINWNSFIQGQRCYICRNIKISKIKKHTFNYVYNFFKQNNCKLLESYYINNCQKLNYKCSCGNISKTNFKDFKQGCRCKHCYLQTNKGLNSNRWNLNRSELKINQNIRIRRTKKWIIKNMSTDPLINEYKNNPEKFQLDHVIPIYFFTKLIIEYNLNEYQVRDLINKRENLQILTKKENSQKRNKGSLFEASQFLINNGINVVNFDIIGYNI